MNPRRDWKCPKCGARSNDVPIDVKDQWCPYCGTLMEKVWEPPTVIFNGDGWTPRFH